MPETIRAKNGDQSTLTDGPYETDDHHCIGCGGYTDCKSPTKDNPPYNGSRCLFWVPKARRKDWSCNTCGHVWGATKEGCRTCLNGSQWKKQEIGNYFHDWKNTMWDTYDNGWVRIHEANTEIKNALDRIKELDGAIRKFCESCKDKDCPSCPIGPIRDDQLYGRDRPKSNNALATTEKQK